MKMFRVSPNEDKIASYLRTQKILMMIAFACQQFMGLNVRKNLILYTLFKPGWNVLLPRMILPDGVKSSLNEVLVLEFIRFFEEAQGQSFTSETALSCRRHALSNVRYLKLFKVSRLLFTVLALAIPVKSLFSELKRHWNGLCARTNVQTLERDAVLYASFSEINHYVLCWFLVVSRNT